MTKASINLQDLRRRIHVEAKADKTWRHLMRARKRKDFGWNRWSRKWLYQALGLYGNYQVRYYQNPKVLPAR